MAERAEELKGRNGQIFGSKKYFEELNKENYLNNIVDNKIHINYYQSISSKTILLKNQLMKLTLI